MADKPYILSAEAIAALPFDFRHPLDDTAELRIFPLSHHTGLTRTGVSLSHLAPGRSSYPQHRHWGEDEWIYLLSGTGTLRLDATDHAMGPGDFAAFPAGGPAHKLTNTGSETLVYLMGGAHSDTDIVDFPEQGVRMTRGADRLETGPIAGFAPFDVFARQKAKDDG